jgi:hypothetical protein
MASDYSSTTSQLFSSAQSATGLASLSAGRIGADVKPNLSNPSLTYTVGPKSFGSAPQFSDLFTGADNTAATTAALNDQVDAWLQKYFPSINSGFKNVPEDYLINVISGVVPFGVEKTVFDLVWQQARDRVYKTVRSERSSLEAAFSSRGFSLPPGALVDALAQSERRATDASIDVVREQAIKEADIKVDILKHAVGIAAQLKMGILSTSADFFRSYYSVYNLGNETARIRAQAYQSFYNALSNYYGAETSWEALRLQSETEKVDLAIGVDRNKIGLYSAGSGASQAQGQAVDAFAKIAGQAYNAAGSLTAQIETL